MRIAFLGDSLTAGIPGSSYLAILRQRLPDDTLINLGRGNDTVISLYRRVAGLPLNDPLDVAFLWIGVNDVSGRAWWPYLVFNALVGQRPAKDLDEFQAYYQSTLELVCRSAERVIAVSPPIRGEDMNNPWNRRLGVFSNAIEDLASHCVRAEFLDLRTVFADRLAGKPVSDYVPRSAIRVALDALTLRSQEQIDRKAAKRGLQFTLDGLHLNSKGAEIVAETFLRAITRQGIG